ncbi:SDR family NAD(P)-dependent oxidoreductase [Flavobacterium branchiarum]|uniref:SDR family oxidoreductase n=1 Tax=Flavobacterium branchiarum TaxID=1114870 RepID=A0ABV5FLI0_9FLAO|nr:SDR family NAD(P)-dependent oxidoreductase [Flavobacterium branchiarum]MDN3672654.1 SDR family NAD(P)-dependent oxidoreductase [Flavobacterium branchiarum]
MILKNKTILITGGGSGIGLEAAKQFLTHGAKVIITGRNQEKLNNAKNEYPSLIVIQSDAANPNDAVTLFQQVKQLGGIDILYHNAGVLAPLLNLGTADDNHVNNAAYEMEVNYLGVIRLNNLFMEMLQSRKEGAIINTTSLLRYVPSIVEPTYSASKAALGFYTESLRKHLQLLNSRVKVFELLPPVIATEMTAERTGKKLTTEEFVKQFIKALIKNEYVIRIGDTKTLYLLNRFFPKLAYRLVNSKESYVSLK